MTQNTPKPGVVISLSGGMDSTALAAFYVKQFGADQVHAVGFEYGQKHNLELVQAGLVAERLGISWKVIELPRIFSGAGSTLMDGDAPVEIVGSYQELSKRFGSQPTVVPNRNMNFISMCATYALTQDVGFVALAVHAGDAGNYHYPDCRAPFIGAMAAAIDIATEGAVALICPFNLLSKGDIVGIGQQCRAPLSLSQSCYNGKRPACGVCATCLERQAAFIEAGYSDPIEYAIPMDWEGFSPYPY